MKKLFTFFRPVAIGLIMLFSSGWVMGQTVTIDFETENDGYTPSGTEGTGSNDVFNRTDPDVGGNSTFIWAVEDINLEEPSITLDQISITGVSSFTFSVDMLTPTSAQWDSTDELLITYSVDGGTYQNLLWVQSSASSNAPAALDLAFDGIGDTGQELPAISDDYSAGVGSDFETFITNGIAISGTTLDIKLQFTNLTATGEGIYLDDIVIELTSGAPTPTITVSPTTLTGFSYVAGSGPSTEQSFTIEGSNLAANITLTPPTNYEISTGTGGSFSATNPITLTQSGGAVAETTIYTRLKAGLSVGNFNDEDITAASTDATSKTVTCSGSVISATPVLTLTTPNGGESWVAGTIHSITWSSVSYSTTVDIEYTTNGTDFTTIADNETDDGTYLWSIPSALAAGTTYKIRISDDKTSITTSDLSDGDFVIKASSTIIINEVDADTEGTDALEFIELYDGGVGNSALDGLVLVLHNGSDDASYEAYDLDTYSTDANGYFVIGSSSVVNVDYDLGAITNIIQNGPDAVALYYGDDSDFPNDTPVTTTNLIDALVYDTSDSDDAGLLVLLNAAEPQVDEAGNGNSARHSNQRFPNGTGGARNTSTYGQYFPTPGAENDEWQTTWTGASDSDTYWETSGNWSDDIPTVNHDVTIPTGKMPIIAASTSANCYDLTLAGTATLTIQSGASNSGSLIFGGTYTGSATAVTYQRYFTDTKEQMFGSPFSGQTIDNDFLTNNSIDGMIHYLEASDSWSVNYTTTLPSSPYNAFAWGTGYMAKRTGTGYTAKRTGGGVVNLTGTPNNAAVDISLTRSNNGWNLLSNPFTSAINATTTAHTTNNLITANSANLDPSYAALYIWNQGTTSYLIINNAGDGSLVQNYLQVAQGFFVKSKTGGGNFTITPAMQSHQTEIAFKSSEETSWASIILNAEINDAKESTKILLREDMRSGLDIGYDAGVFKSNPDFSLYSRLVEDNGIDFGLQCLPSNYNELIIPIGLDAKANEIVKFSVNALNIPEEYAVILEDRTANTFTNLSDETAEYTIQLTNDSDGTGRFFIHTSFKSALEIDDLATVNAFQVFSRAKDHQLVIRGNANENATARIYSITGKQIAVVNLKPSAENIIPFNEEAGVYIVQITNEGETQTQKFVWVK